MIKIKIFSIQTKSRILLHRKSEDFLVPHTGGVRA